MGKLSRRIFNQVKNSSATVETGSIKVSGSLYVAPYEPIVQYFSYIWSPLCHLSPTSSSIIRASHLNLKEGSRFVSATQKFSEFTKSLSNKQKINVRS